MRSDGHPEEIAPDARGMPIPTKEVARLAQCGPDLRWEGILEPIIAEARILLKPRARWTPLAPGAIGDLFLGSTPVEAIARGARTWTFIATIGSELERQVREHFDAGRYLDGVILDAAGSVAVEALADAVEHECAGEEASARFSPGYCMWSLESQRSLFELLRPEELGIRLLPSMLMDPLKSVSGVVVRGRAQHLLVPREACEQCDARGCTRRGTT